MISHSQPMPRARLDAGAHGLAEALDVLAAWRRASLMRKLQCMSETCAPPTRKPRQPAASISFQELWPGGFLKVEPPVRSLIGWLVSR